MATNLLLGTLGRGPDDSRTSSPDSRTQTARGRLPTLPTVPNVVRRMARFPVPGDLAQGQPDAAGPQRHRSATTRKRGCPGRASLPRGSPGPFRIWDFPKRNGATFVDTCSWGVHERVLPGPTRRARAQFHTLAGLISYALPPGRPPENPCPPPRGGWVWSAPMGVPKHTPLGTIRDRGSDLLN